MSKAAFVNKLLCVMGYIFKFRYVEFIPCGIPDSCQAWASLLSQAHIWPRLYGQKVLGIIPLCSTISFSSEGLVIRFWY